jgi:hypothetical protein
VFTHSHTGHVPHQFSVYSGMFLELCHPVVEFFLDVVCVKPVLCQGVNEKLSHWSVTGAVMPAPDDQVGAQMAILCIVHRVGIVEAPQNAVLEEVRIKIVTKIPEAELVPHPGTCSWAQIVDRGCSIEIHPLRKRLEGFWIERLEIDFMMCATADVLGIV